ncbi:hypothetical protein LR48_Vigan03g050000 [Vigna angularis]|uniref:Uncharacterized protein n=1 Tax=Phaseolus angularis TaxID=3914 RepID=A0A0L9U3Y4_PHAAN|nr:hypothetical protein LR48_Vigan03g050000 [Vigna angularis]
MQSFKSKRRLEERRKSIQVFLYDLGLWSVLKVATGPPGIRNIRPSAGRTFAHGVDARLGTLAQELGHLPNMERPSECWTFAQVGRPPMKWMLAQVLDDRPMWNARQYEASAQCGTSARVLDVRPSRTSAHEVDARLSAGRPPKK